MTARQADEALAAARRVADAVLYEGYVLYPYRASAAKNRYRWQFGVVIPEAQVRAGTPEPAEVTSQCLLRDGDDCRVEVIARFLRVRRRDVERSAADGYRAVDELEVDGRLFVAWDEGLEQEIRLGPLGLDPLLAEPNDVFFELPPQAEVQDLLNRKGAAVGRIRRSAPAVSGVLRVQAEQLAGGVVRLTATVSNHTAWSQTGAPRDDVLRHSLVGLHLLLRTESGAFASLIDPPRWAADWVGTLDNRHTYPVLAGPPGHDQLILSAPIILYDHPEIAGESAGDSFDATEIDELLTLAVRSLTDEEKRSARATDPRAAELVDRADALPPDIMERLHGAIRQFRPAATSAERHPTNVPDDRGKAVDEDLAAFFGVDEPPVERVSIDGRELAVGDDVRLRPTRRADAQDIFAVGRLARVERIEHDVEGQAYLAVTLRDDPAAELRGWSGRFLYFHPDEVEPVHAGELEPRTREA